MGFAEGFTRGHQRGSTSRAVREESDQRRQRLAQDAERLKLEARRAETELKLHEMQASNAATATAIQAAGMTNAPTTAVSPEAGGVGPPAPAARPSLPLQLGDGTTMKVEPQFADDRAIAARAAGDAALEQKQQYENVAIPSELRGLVTKLLGPGAAGITSLDPKLLTAASTAYGQDQATVRDTNNAPKAEKLVRVDNPDGSYQFVPQSAVVGETFRKPSKVTDGQRRVLGFYSRAKDAEDTLSAKPADGAPSLEEGVGKRGLVGQARLNGPDILQDDEGQVYTQVQRQFIEATLRKDSGAAIAPAEFKKAARTYFVQPGDGPPVIARKRLARAVQLEALRREAGPAYDEQYGAPSTTAPGAKQGPAPKLGGTTIGRFSVQVEQ